ncbi:MAG TPA: S8 family serine peptidase [Blastocatellia bacterium]|nr:S8 family serine peptidase [Blastocatellia bacterium]
MQREMIVMLESVETPDSNNSPFFAFETAPLVERVTECGGVIRRGFRGLSARKSSNHLANSSPLAEEGDISSAHDLSRFFRVEADDAELDKLAEEFLKTSGVAAAYIQPRTGLPLVDLQSINKMRPSPTPPPQTTPDLSARQIYLNAAPDGIDAHYAWSLNGGKGEGVQIIDIEWAWNTTHENLIHHEIPIYGGAPRYISEDEGFIGRNHGTAVFGVTSARHGESGIKGICPNAYVQAITHYGGLGSGEVIALAARWLKPGDIIMLEMHRPGPRCGYKECDDQLGYIPIEWWPYDLAAIKEAVARGVVVIEAAGNGSENLDDARYDKRPRGFPLEWQNPFRRNPVDSGAILVGAGAPPPGTHDCDHGPARSRLDFSNFGSMIDAQGWGAEVTTCGYGDYQGGDEQEDVWYTDRFSGTSSATPIVAGAIACVQGVRKANNLLPCTPAQLRSLLQQDTGSPQQDGPTDYDGSIINPQTERIGQLPNLRSLIEKALSLP